MKGLLVIAVSALSLAACVGDEGQMPVRSASSTTGFAFDARNLSGTTPFEWWTQIDNVSISTSPVTNRGHGAIQLASTAQPLRQLQINIHVPGAPVTAALHVECTFAAPVPDRVLWAATIGTAAGGVAQRVGGDPVWAFDVPAGPRSDGDPTVTITPVWAQPSVTAGLSHCAVETR